MGFGGLSHKDSLSFHPTRPSNSDNLFATLPRLTHPQTPPESTYGSPTFKPEGSFSNSSRECSPIPRLTRFSTPSSSPVRLPSLEEFDQGVEALARSHGPSYRWTSSPRSPPLLPSLRRGPSFPPHPPHHTPQHHHHQSLPSLSSSFAASASPAFSATSSPLEPHPSSASSSAASPLSYLPFPLGDPLGYAHSLDGYASSPSDAENRHINQKYTTEEGDFIIYAWHDKKLKWQRIKQDFAAMFGRTPERTVQGLQAWYYRMNQRIPMWDDEGWLLFDNEDDLEPKHVSIKCRERDNQDKPTEPLGLAQRYPERAIHYSWVDADTKRKSRDWAAKRALQYRERRERRKRKEQRRMKL
ncbi:hypothetical protein ESCO_006064 [Escovopsis weberi]|uniref:Uncharacterized protein n=1 Tax=Escovopsis weberi TaxID=150374 RepID=A0A0M8MUL1_ESCWE|nr:hypothetical protein ESCO_006064 [Escovopsis weberi]